LKDKQQLLKYNYCIVVERKVVVGENKIITTERKVIIVERKVTTIEKMAIIKQQLIERQYLSNNQEKCSN
jgi:hypothetical protein